MIKSGGAPPARCEVSSGEPSLDTQSQSEECMFGALRIRGSGWGLELKVWLGRV